MTATTTPPVVENASTAGAPPADVAHTCVEVRVRLCELESLRQRAEANEIREKGLLFGGFFVGCLFTAALAYAIASDM